MALARMLTVSGNDVTVWSALEQEIDNLSTTRVHPNLPGMTIPAEMKFTKSVEEVCTDKEILLFAVPSVFVRSTAAKARPFVPDGQIIVDVAKGIEKDTLFTMTEILADELGKEGGPKGVRLVALSGPTHAEEVAIDLPTTIVSASKDMEAAAYVQEIFTNPSHPYTIGLMRPSPLSAKKWTACTPSPARSPNPVDMPNYCYFKDRCELQLPCCSGEYPCEISLSPTHKVSCYRYYEENRKAGE